MIPVLINGTVCGSLIPATSSKFFSPASINSNLIYFSTSACDGSVPTNRNTVSAVYVHINLMCCLYNAGSCLAALYFENRAPGADESKFGLAPACICAGPVTCTGANAIDSTTCPQTLIGSNALPGGCSGCDDVKSLTPIMQNQFSFCPLEMKLNLFGSQLTAPLQCTNVSVNPGIMCRVPYLHDSFKYNSLTAPTTINYGWLCLSYENYGVSDRTFIVCGNNRYSKVIAYTGGNACNDAVVQDMVAATFSTLTFPVPDLVMQLPLFGADSSISALNTLLSCPAQWGGSQTGVGHFATPSPPNGGYYGFAPFHAVCDIEGQSIPTCSIYHLAMIVLQRVLSLSGDISFVNRAPIDSLLNTVDPLGVTSGKPNVVHFLQKLEFLANTPAGQDSPLLTVPDNINLALVTPRIFYWDPVNFSAAPPNAEKWKHIYHIGERNVILDTGCTATTGTRRRLGYVDTVLGSARSSGSNPYRMFSFMNCQASASTALMTIDIDAMGCASACARCAGGCTIDSGTGSAGNSPGPGTGGTSPSGGTSGALFTNSSCGSAPSCSGIWFNENGELIDCGGSTTVEVFASSTCGCDCAPVGPSVSFTYEEAYALYQTGCLISGPEQAIACMDGYPVAIYPPVFSNDNTLCGSLWDEIACGCTCLAFGTQVLMSDGTEKSVEKLRVGDSVLGIRFGTSADPVVSMPDNNIISSGWTAPSIDTWQFVPVTIAQIQIGFESERYSIGSMGASFEHPILIKDGNNFKFRSISIISSDYYVVDRNLQLMQVSEVVRQVRPTMTVALSLNGAHALIAGGIIVHDGGIPASSTTAETGIALSSGVTVDPCSKNLVI
jgi:hypothetical protein